MGMKKRAEMKKKKVIRERDAYNLAMKACNYFLLYIAYYKAFTYLIEGLVMYIVQVRAFETPGGPNIIVKIIALATTMHSLKSSYKGFTKLSKEVRLGTMEKP
jgi:hypothetical protein